MLTRRVLRAPLLRAVGLVSKSCISRTSRMVSSDANANEEPVEDKTEDVPWYMRLEESSTTQELTKPLPELPLSSPESLLKVVKLIHDKLGIVDIKIFDKRDEDPEEVGLDTSKTFIVIGTGKSDRHLQKATIELMNFIKHDLGYERLPKVEGFTRASSILKKEKKLKRKLKKNTGYHFEDYGVPVNSWIMVDCDHSIENMSIHFVTEQRREELNLELLWCKPEEKHLYKRVKKPLINDDIFSGLRRYHRVRNEPVYKTVIDLMKGSKRFYSSSLDASKNIPPPQSDHLTSDFLKASDTGDYETARRLLLALDCNEVFKPFVMKSFISYLDILTTELVSKLKTEPELRSDRELALKLTLEDVETKFRHSIPSVATKESMDLKIQFYKKLHQLWPNMYSFDLLEKAFFEKLSISYIDNSIDDIIDHMVLILESRARSYVFRMKKINALLAVVELNESLIKSWETKLVPYLLVSFSKFDHPEFVNPKAVLSSINSAEKFNPSKKLAYEDQIQSILSLLNYKKFQFLDSNESQFILLMFLTIYGNAKDYTLFYDILRKVHDTSSLQPDKRPWDFIISYIYKTSDIAQYHYFVTAVYPKISYYSNFSDLFNEYLQKMKLEIEQDEPSKLFCI